MNEDYLVRTGEMKGSIGQRHKRNVLTSSVEKDKVEGKYGVLPAGTRRAVQNENKSHTHASHLTFFNSLSPKLLVHIPLILLGPAIFPFLDNPCAGEEKYHAGLEHCADKGARVEHTPTDRYVPIFLLYSLIIVPAES